MGREALRKQRPGEAVLQQPVYEQHPPTRHHRLSRNFRGSLVMSSVLCKAVEAGARVMHGDLSHVSYNDYFNLNFVQRTLQAKRSICLSFPFV